MDPEDFLESEVAVAAAVTAALLAPPVRAVLRRATVLGLAGLLSAGGAGFTHGIRVIQDIRDVAAPTPDGLEDIHTQPEAVGDSTRGRARKRSQSSKE